MHGVGKGLTKSLVGKRFVLSLSISRYCCPVNFKTADKSSPKPFRIGLRAFFFSESKVTKEAEIPQEGFSLIFRRVKLLPDSNILKYNSGASHK
mgnify:CR=1 FL=1